MSLIGKVLPRNSVETSVLSEKVHHESEPRNRLVQESVDSNPQVDRRASTVDGGATTAIVKSTLINDMYKARGLSMYVYRLSGYRDIHIVYVRCPRRCPTLDKR